jgi:hypothetical protein
LSLAQKRAGLLREAWESNKKAEAVARELIGHPHQRVEYDQRMEIILGNRDRLLQELYEWTGTAEEYRDLIEEEANDEEDDGYGDDDETSRRWENFKPDDEKFNDDEEEEEEDESRQLRQRRHVKPRT